jgi:hypothetical protein
MAFKPDDDTSAMSHPDVPMGAISGGDTDRYICNLRYLKSSGNKTQYEK